MDEKLNAVAESIKLHRAIRRISQIALIESAIAHDAKLIDEQVSDGEEGATLTLEALLNTKHNR
jgi:hypothetical protein